MGEATEKRLQQIEKEIESLEEKIEGIDDPDLVDPAEEKIAKLVEEREKLMDEVDSKEEENVSESRIMGFNAYAEKHFDL